MLGRASLFHLTPYRLFTPYFKKLGPKWFRRRLLDMVPIQGIQRLKDMADIVDENTRRVFFEKRTALEAGDAAVKAQVANGKDIMSILCEFIRAQTIPSSTPLKDYWS